MSGMEKNNLHQKICCVFHASLPAVLHGTIAITHLMYATVELLKDQILSLSTCHLLPLIPVAAVPEHRGTDVGLLHEVIQ